MLAPTRWLVLILLLIATITSVAHAQLPPSPSPSYIADRGNVLSPATRNNLNTQLAQFERETSNQIVVAIEPNLPRTDTLESYANKLFNHWQIGQKSRNNGVLLLVITGQRELRIEVGYGLEGTLPDATAKRIIDNDIVPRFRSGDFDGGIQTGVNSIIAATKGEYRGTGKLVSEQQKRDFLKKFVIAVFAIIVIIITILGLIFKPLYGSSYSSRGYTPWWAQTCITISDLVIQLLINIALSALSGGKGGGGRSSSSGGGGGGFSGGGGSSGGGGASGRW